MSIREHSSACTEEVEEEERGVGRERREVCRARETWPSSTPAIAYIAALRAALLAVLLCCFGLLLDLTQYLLTRARAFARHRPRLIYLHLIRTLVPRLGEAFWGCLAYATVAHAEIY